MKIALIGNMNNNNFALMRYFRDLGANAFLILWANDGINSLSHFSPISDTWNYGKWEPYLRHSSLWNGERFFYGYISRLIFPSAKSEVSKIFSPYNVFIGSGLSPAVLRSIGKQLNIFYPYCTGIEFVSDPTRNIDSGKFSRIERWKMRSVRKKQISGIKQAGVCLNSELGLTKDIFHSMGISPINMACPMVYNKETPDMEVVERKLGPYLSRIRSAEISIFSHSRHLWRNTSGMHLSSWSTVTKNNDWLIRGFAEFIKKKMVGNPLLVMSEYGQDLENSRQLCWDLGIDASVMWIPKLPRKELMVLLSGCDLGVGEFTVSPGCIWGGTGWEVLSSGKPLMQSFNFTFNKYVSEYGYEPPPILDIKSPDDVTRFMVDWTLNKDKYVQIGLDSKKWFNTHNGMGLAKKWLDLITSSRNEAG